VSAEEGKVEITRVCYDQGESDTSGQEASLPGACEGPVRVSSVARVRGISFEVLQCAQVRLIVPIGHPP
jgi:hypothetical protein